jgi:hypothetical protein
MNRRLFLSTLGLAAAGMALDPERLLWVPGQKTIFLPPVRSAWTITLLDHLKKPVAVEWLTLGPEGPYLGIDKTFKAFSQPCTVSNYRIDGPRGERLEGGIITPRHVLADDTVT